MALEVRNVTIVAETVTNCAAPELSLDPVRRNYKLAFTPEKPF